MDDEFGEKPQAATKSHGGEVAADAEGRSGVDAAQARVEAFTSAVSEGVTHLEVMEKTMEKWGGPYFIHGLSWKNLENHIWLSMILTLF